MFLDVKGIEELINETWNESVLMTDCHFTDNSALELL